MFLWLMCTFVLTPCFPRVSGDVSTFIPALAGVVRFSPRERGCFHLNLGFELWVQVFPA